MRPWSKFYARSVLAGIFCFCFKRWRVWWGLPRRPCLHSSRTSRQARGGSKGRCTRLKRKKNKLFVRQGLINIFCGTTWKISIGSSELPLQYIKSLIMVPTLVVCTVLFGYSIKRRPLIKYPHEKFVCYLLWRTCPDNRDRRCGRKAGWRAWWGGTGRWRSRRSPPRCRTRSSCRPRTQCIPSRGQRSTESCLMKLCWLEYTQKNTNFMSRRFTFVYIPSCNKVIFDVKITLILKIQFPRFLPTW